MTWVTQVMGKREAKIRGVIEATAGLYGDLRGIAAKAFAEIDGFALPMIKAHAAGYNFRLVLSWLKAFL